jgi:3-oxoacyl-[acyl-carrier protein] reductase
MLDGQRALIEEISEVDVLVNNAGVSPVETKDKTQLDSDVFREVIETNLTGVMELSKGFYESLKRRNGCIVNIGSVASHRSLKNAPAYTASKTGLLGLTRVLADRWARDGIRVNMIAPGFIETRMTETFRESEDSERRLVAGIPMRRWGTPAEIGGAALFLVSPAAAYITGVSLAVDGGLMLGTVKISGSD